MALVPLPPSAAPLTGLAVMITRAADQAEDWRGVLAARGARVIEVPCIRSTPTAELGVLATAAASLQGFRWVLLTSPNGVRAFAAALPRGWPGGPRVAVVGPGTARAAAAAGLPVDLVAERPDGLGLAAAQAAAGELAGGRLLLPRGDPARAALAAALRAAGADVTEVIAYRTAVDPDLREGLAAALALATPDWIALASGSAFRALRDAWPTTPSLAAVRLATIGPRTSAVVREAGFRVAAEAAAPTAEALALAIATAGCA